MNISTCTYYWQKTHLKPVNECENRLESIICQQTICILKVFNSGWFAGWSIHYIRLAGMRTEQHICYKISEKSFITGMTLTTLVTTKSDAIYPSSIQCTIKTTSGLILGWSGLNSDWSKYRDLRPAKCIIRALYIVRLWCELLVFAFSFPFKIRVNCWFMYY